MNINSVANRLRKRMLPAMLEPGVSRRDARRELASCGDEEVIWSYLTCCQCHQKIVPDFKPMLAGVQNADQFAWLADLLVVVHKCEVHGEVLRNYAGEPVPTAVLRDSLRCFLGRTQNAQPSESGLTVWDAAGTWATRRWSSARREPHPTIGRNRLSELVNGGLDACLGSDNDHWLFVYLAGSVQPLFECRADWAAKAVVQAKLERMARGAGGLVFSVKIHLGGSPYAWMEFNELVVAPVTHAVKGALKR